MSTADVVGLVELLTGWKPGSLGTRSQAFTHSGPVKLCDEGEDPSFVAVKAGVECLSSVWLGGCRRWPFDSMRSTADIVPVSRRGWEEKESKKINTSYSSSSCQRRWTGKCSDGWLCDKMVFRDPITQEGALVLPVLIALKYWSNGTGRPMLTYEIGSFFGDDSRRCM